MKKKILFIHSGIFQHERWGRTFPLARATAKLGFDVTLLTIDYRRGFGISKESLDGVTVIRCKDVMSRYLLIHGFALINFFYRIFFVLLHNFDYVFTDCGESIDTGWAAKIAQKKKSVYISEWADLLGHGGYYDTKPLWFKLFYGNYFLWSEKYFRKTADYVVVLSSKMSNHALQCGIPRNKIIIVPGGSMTDLIDYKYESSKHVGLPENVIKLGYVGISSGDLLDIMPIIDTVKKEKYRKKFKVVTFGETLSDAIIEKYGLQDILINYGWINYYKDCRPLQTIDIFLLIKSNNIERNSMGWPNKLGDYMTVGRPVLITPYGDIRTFINKYPNGFIVLDSYNDIEHAFDNILAGKFNLTEMGNFNRTIAEKYISWDARALKLFNIIKNGK